MNENEDNKTARKISRLSLARQKIFMARHWDASLFDMGHINPKREWEVPSGVDGQ